MKVFVVNISIENIENWTNLFIFLIDFAKKSGLSYIVLFVTFSNLGSELTTPYFFFFPQIYWEIKSSLKKQQHPQTFENGLFPWTE